MSLSFYLLGACNEGTYVRMLAASSLCSDSDTTKAKHKGMSKERKESMLPTFISSIGLFFS